MDLASPLETVDFPSDEEEDIPIGARTPQLEDVAGQENGWMQEFGAVGAKEAMTREEEDEIPDLEGERRLIKSRLAISGPSSTAQAGKKRRPICSMSEAQ